MQHEGVESPMEGERHSDPGAPPRIVLDAFGASDKPTLMAGGQGQNYRSGHLVLKPAKDDKETNWIAEFYLSVNCKGFRLPTPILSQDKRFVFGGWQAWEYIEGQSVRGYWREIIEICILFHEAIADYAKPDYFTRRDQNPWVTADKVAWDELEIDHHPRIEPVFKRLHQCLRPVYGKSQLIHGDFGGNILFYDAFPPAIIDFSPYWRPVAFAVGVIIADAIVWEGADVSLIEMGCQFANFDQYLARAEIRRIVELETTYKLYGWDMINEVEAHLPLINIICERWA